MRRLASRARRVGSVCTGAFILAEAGLLDGRRATTHWAFCAELAGAYPAVTVEPDAMFVRDGSIVTAGGVTAGADLALALVEEDHGAELARLVAKWLILFVRRPGGQAQFSIWQQDFPHCSRALGALLSDIAANPEGDLSVPAMARRLSVSPRHLSRVFHDQVGVSPGRYVERARVAAARSLLENSEEGLDAIARRCGFGTAETMRRTFIRELGVPPSSCRAFFAGPSVHVPS